MLGAFTSDMPDDATFVAMLAIGGTQSGGNGWCLGNNGRCLLLAKGLGIVECVSI